MAPRPVLFVQGAGDLRAPDGSGVLADHLTRELGSGHVVHAPEMPEADVNPAYEPWRDRILQELGAMDGPVILVGHSFGASVILKTLAEVTVPRIAGIFLVALPDWGPQGWDYDAFAVPDDIATALDATPTFLYHSADDPEVPFAHLALAQAKLPSAHTRVIPGTEHSFVHGLPELVRDIRNLPA